MSSFLSESLMCSQALFGHFLTVEVIFRQTWGCIISLLLPPLHPSGGRSSQAIVDGAMNALRTLVKDRMSGKSGSSGYKQVGPVVKHWGLKLETLWTLFSNTQLSSSRAAAAAAAAVSRTWSSSLMTTLTRWCWRVMMCGWWNSSPRGVDTARSECGTWHSPSTARRRREMKYRSLRFLLSWYSNDFWNFVFLSG